MPNASCGSNKTGGHYTLPVAVCLGSDDLQAPFLRIGRAKTSNARQVYIISAHAHLSIATSSRLQDWSAPAWSQHLRVSLEFTGSCGNVPSLELTMQRDNRVLADPLANPLPSGLLSPPIRATQHWPIVQMDLERPRLAKRIGFRLASAAGGWG